MVGRNPAKVRTVRMSIDLEYGSYQKLTAILEEHNENRFRGNRYNHTPREAFLSRNRLIRGFLGTWMHQHRNGAK